MEQSLFSGMGKCAVMIKNNVFSKIVQIRNNAKHFQGYIFNILSMYLVRFSH